MTTMSTKAEFAVTLSPELFARLTSEARALGLSLEWLVAALLVDTFEDEPVAACA
jgi:hypothetical protein